MTNATFINHGAKRIQRCTGDTEIDRAHVSTRDRRECTIEEWDNEMKGYKKKKKENVQAQREMERCELLSHCSYRYVSLIVSNDKDHSFFISSLSLCVCIFCGLMRIYVFLWSCLRSSFLNEWLYETFHAGYFQHISCAIIPNLHLRYCMAFLSSSTDFDRFIWK